MTDPRRHLMGLQKPIERKVLEAFFNLLKGDEILGDQEIGFFPWRLVETPLRENLEDYAEWSALVQPLNIKPSDKPSAVQAVVVSASVSFFLPGLNAADEDSDWYFTGLWNHVRKLIWNNQRLNDPDPPGRRITTAVSAIEPMQPWFTPKRVRMLSFKGTWETLVDPKTGEIESR